MSGITAGRRRVRGWRCAGAVLVLAGAAACTSPAIRYSDDPAASGSSALPGPVATIPPEQRSRDTPPAGPADDPAPPDDSAAVLATGRPPAARDPAIAVNGDPDRLMGLRRVALPAALGAPVLVRQDGPSEIWQYEAEGCVLDVFLYRDSKAADLAVVHVEGRDKHGTPVSTRRCLSAVEDNRAAVPTG